MKYEIFLLKKCYLCRKFFKGFLTDFGSLGKINLNIKTYKNNEINYKFMKTALYPGTFDPVTNGHKSIMLQASFLFDRLIVAIGNNSKKQCMFSLEKRLAMLKKIVEDYEKLGGDENIEVTYYEGLTIDFCKKNGIEYIVRGVRSNTDLSVEMSIANANKLLYDSVNTIFFPADVEDAGISSSIVREILANNGNVSAFVPRVVLDMLKK